MLHPLTVTVNMAPICSGLEPRSTPRLSVYLSVFDSKSRRQLTPQKVTAVVARVTEEMLIL